MKKRIIILIGLIITILGAYISFSYALFEKTETQTDENTIITYNCLDIEIEGNNELNLTNAFPIEDEEGVQQTPYTFKIKNKCDKYVSVDVGIELNNTFSDEKLKVTLNKKFEDPIGSLLSTHREYNTENDVQVLSNQYILLHDGINANSEANYEYRMWIDYSAGNEIVGTTFKGKIIATATIRTEEPHGWSNSKEGMLLYALKRDNQITEPLTQPGKDVNLPEESELSSASDDYGTSYYFRGNVENNYLVFANKCWRIVRITGDGSIKLVLYNDNPNHLDNNNVCKEVGDTLAYSRYDGTNYLSYYNPNNNYNAYIGFMYGTPGSSSYEKEHENVNDSIFLSRLKSWYNLEGTFTNAEKKMLADIIWCGDKRVVTDLGFNPNNWKNFSNKGFGTETTYYQGYYKIVNGMPSLECGNDINDNKISKYTAVDTTYGNGDLKGYKIGLLTADELMLSGMTLNSYNGYLTKNLSTASQTGFRTMTPSVFSTGSTVYSYYFFGSLDIHGLYGINSGSANYHGVRPAIALISNVKITNTNQNGTINNPYIIET